MLQRTVAFACAYAAAVLLGRMLILPETQLALIWPAGGVGVLWAIFATSRRELRLIAAWVLAVVTVGTATTGVSVAGSVLIAAANLVVVLGSRWAIDRLARGRPFEILAAADIRVLVSATDLVRLALGTLLPVLTSAGIGMLAVYVDGSSPGAASALSWVVRHVTAMLLVTAPGLALYCWRSATRWPHPAELACLLVTTGVVQVAVFAPDHQLPIGYVALLPVIWSGVRTPLPFAATHGALVGASSVALLLLTGGGPYAEIENAGVRALSVQGFIVLATHLALVLAVMMARQHDLTDTLSESESDARAHAADLQTITDTIPDALLVVGREGWVSVHNDAGQRYLDRCSGEWWRRGDAVSLVRYDAGGQEVAYDQRPAVRALRGEHVHDLPARAREGSTPGDLVYSVSAAPLYPGHGTEPDRALLVIRDITSEHEQGIAVRRARARAERLFEDAPNGVAVLSSDGTVLRANRALETLLDRPATALVGCRWQQLSAEQAPDLREYLDQVLAADGGEVSCTYPLARRDGADVHVTMAGRLLPGVDDHADTILVHVIDISERMRYESRLAYLADHDVLTGLFNRHRFDQELTSHVERGERYGWKGALLVIDLDNFKEVNDTLGHGAGDQLIMSVGRVLSENFRATDVVARIGGDEFAVLLPEADRAQAEAIAGNLVRRIESHTSTLDGVHRWVTASVGAVTFDAAASLGNDAMALMYDAKAAGRNRFAITETAHARQPRLGARLEWKGRLEKALEDDLFELYFQPILDLRTNEIHSAEVLLRLVDRGHPVSPGRFIYIAEQTGLAPAVDAWVARHSIERLAQLREHDPAFTLEVNVSARSMGEPVLEDAILESLDVHRLDPRALVLEITETAAVSDLATARTFAQRMTSVGTRFALDDFGSGYGSFYYLKHLDFDFVKIDGEFVTHADTSAVDRTILRSIVGIAHDLGKLSVAEFVADEAALGVVRDEGVDLAQGFHIGHPCVFGEFVPAFVNQRGGLRADVSAGSPGSGSEGP